MNLCAVGLVVALMLGGCMPSSVTISLRPESLDLREAEVLADERATHKVALIDARGLIADSSRSGLFMDGPNPVDEVLRRLNEAADDRSVKAIVIRINSPGGTVTASDILYREIERFRRETGKPVVASLGELAASGGYYIALAADRIVAEPTSITGSIGVLFPGINVSRGLASIGVFSTTVTSGPNKALGDPLGPINQEHQAILQGLVDEYHAMFVERVRSRRVVDANRLSELTDGRVVTGAEAARAGLADELGGVREAFEAAKSLAGLERARLIKYHTSRDSLRPRTAYGGSAEHGHADYIEIGPLSIDAGIFPGAGMIEPGMAYFLWVPGLN